MKLRTPLLVAALMASPFVASAAVITYTGSLSTADGGLVGTGAWVTDASVSWVVQHDTVKNDWTYTYTYVVAAHAISHLIFETSQCFGQDDIESISSPTGAIADFEVGDYEAGGSNPNMPGPIKGTKVDTQGDPLSFTVSFTTAAAAVWGDTYWKNGKDKVSGQFTSATNAGFLAADPTGPIGNGSLNGHMLTPGNELSCIPEPTALFLASLGAAGFFRRRRDEC